MRERERERLISIHSIGRVSSLKFISQALHVELNTYESVYLMRSLMIGKQAPFIFNNKHYKIQSLYHHLINRGIDFPSKHSMWQEWTLYTHTHTHTMNTGRKLFLSENQDHPTKQRYLPIYLVYVYRHPLIDTLNLINKSTSPGVMFPR